MDRIDRILLAERELTPSSDFASRVMESVHAEEGPPPIPFPWLPFALGFVALPALLLAALWFGQPLWAGLLDADVVDPRLLWGLALMAASVLAGLWSFQLVSGD